jgi:prefoldin beta subunit
MDEMPPQVKQKIAQFQQLQQQIQVLSSQKFQLEAQLRDTERAVDELEKTSKDASIYKSIGNLLIKVDKKDDLEAELKDKKESLDIRLKTIDKQEKHLIEKYQALQMELTQALQGPGTSPPTGS